MKFPEKESITIEFKSDVKCYPMDRLYYDVCSMANSEGGILYLGIEDDGRVSGVCKQHSDAVKMKAAIQEHTYPPVPVSVTLEESDEGQKVLVINIDSPDQLYATSDGRYGERRLHQDGEPYTKPLTPPEIVQRLSYLQLLDPSAQVITSITAA